MKKSLSIIVASLVITGCGTGYKKDSFTGGYEETWLARDSVRISYRGNAFTKTQEAIDYSLLRVAEIGVEKGFKYFMLVSEGSSIETVKTPTTYHANTYGSAIGNPNGATYSGSTTVTQSGGHIFKKPSANNQAIYFNERPQVTGTIVYETEFVCDSIKQKYKLKNVMCN